MAINSLSRFGKIIWEIVFIPTNELISEKNLGKDDN